MKTKTRSTGKQLAIVLLSGGLDSCVTLAIAAKEYKVALLHIQYSQRTQSRESLAFHEIADYYHVPEDKILVTRLDHLKKIGGSSLTDIHLPIDNDTAESVVPNTYVPFRNTLMLSIAVSWAEVIKAEKIFIGAVEQDSPNYPDCRKEYYDTFNKLVEVGTMPSTHIKVVTPLIGMKKSEIVKMGIELSAPLPLTWSCYKNNDLACGKCQSCTLRLRAFEDAGYRDKIPYLEEKNSCNF
ncbi:MAG: 7-cyano-7-deazaguanine synthase QueC [Candidatus Scalindua sp.]|nr:7-cyano-7-deazaguanine synthase QueC [Candidatus Scalindua sp.]